MGSGRDKSEKDYVCSFLRGTHEIKKCQEGMNDNYIRKRKSKIQKNDKNCTAQNQ